MKLHNRINGEVLADRARVLIVKSADCHAAAIVDTQNRLIAWALQGWHDATNVCDIVWTWVRKDFRFIPKKVKKGS